MFCVQVEHYEGLNRTPALPLAVRGWTELVDCGYCGDTVLVTADQHALVVFVSEKPVGVLTYRHDPVLKEFVVGIGFVLPDRRGAGLYRMLWDHLVARAQRLGARQITSMVFAANTAMRAVASRQGRIERQVVLEFAVPPAGASTGPALGAERPPLSQPMLTDVEMTQLRRSSQETMRYFRTLGRNNHA